MGGLFDSFDAENVLPKMDIKDYFSKLKGDVGKAVNYGFKPESMAGFKAKMAEDVASTGAKAMQGGGALEKLMLLAKANPKTALALGGVGALGLGAGGAFALEDAYRKNVGGPFDKIIKAAQDNPQTTALIAGAGGSALAKFLNSETGRSIGDIYNINSNDIDSKMASTLKNNEKLRKLMKGNK